MAVNNELDEMQNSRRSFLRNFGRAIGGTALAATMSPAMISSALAYSPNVDSSNKNGLIFPKESMQILKAICQVVIPRTNTPGAADVDCHGFVDHQLFHCFPKAVQQRGKKFLIRINKVAQQRHQKTFIQLNYQQQFELLTDVEAAKNGLNKKDKGAFKHLKGLIAFGYYTSEAGAKDELRYLPVPGGYKGSIKYTNNEGAWSN